MGIGKSLGQWGRDWETERNGTTRDRAGDGRCTGKEKQTGYFRPNRREEKEKYDNLLDPRTH